MRAESVQSASKGGERTKSDRVGGGSRANTIDVIRAPTTSARRNVIVRGALELADRSPTARGIIEAFLPQHHAARIVELDYGFEFEMPIQVEPDLIRALVGNNIAVYQLVRLAKTKGHWRNHST